jgi:acyl dehydratase
MAIDYKTLLARKFPVVEHPYSERDTLLYALGVGLGADPLEREPLRFVYERGLRVLPTMAAVLAGPGFWVREPDTGVDWVRVLHGEQDMVFHRPLPPTGTVRAQTRVTAILDKGAGKGALIQTERQGADAVTGETLFTVRQTIFARGDGGFDGPAASRGPAPAPHPIPERAPDVVCDLPTLPQQALIYRLSGDYNPLHADPDVAAQAGYPRPILHGLCTLGVAGHALLKTCCGYDPARLRAMQVRFTAPVFPGETLRTELWRDGAVVSFRTQVPGRNSVVLNNGRAEVTA